MDGNKTRFVQPRTAPETARGEMVARQVFPINAFFMFAANSLPAVRYKKPGEEKL
jgi:hypothetical protein